MSELIKRIGQLFIMGFPGNKPPQTFLDFAVDVLLGGVIIFEDNCTEYGTTRQCIADFKALLGSQTPFIAIDQEGGRVSRLRGAPAEFKSPAEYGRDNDVEHFREDYARSAVYMESLGINLNLMPVADIAVQEDNSCLRDRCFSGDAEEVAEYTRAAVKVSRESGLLCCAKHFPGLGAAVNDPHEKTAVANYDMIVWHQRERVPFKAAVEEGVDLVMTTHMKVPRIDQKIVTGSSKVITEMLRQELAFDGPIITDDLTMAGAKALGDIGQRTVTAFNAGHDILLFGQDYEVAFRAYHHFVEAFKKGEISEQRVNNALERVMGIKFKIKQSVLR